MIQKLASLNGSLFLIGKINSHHFNECMAVYLVGYQLNAGQFQSRRKVQGERLNLGG